MYIGCISRMKLFVITYFFSNTFGYSKTEFIKAILRWEGVHLIFYFYIVDAFTCTFVFYVCA